MVKKSPLPKGRYHIMLFVEDWDFLEAEYGPASPKPIGMSAAITAIVHAKVLDLRAQAAEAFEEISQRQRARQSDRQMGETGGMFLDVALGVDHGGKR